MSNIIDNLLPTEKAIKTNSPLTSDQSVKDKPSLFDSLLSNIFPKDGPAVDPQNSSEKEIKKEKSLNTILDTKTNEDLQLLDDETVSLIKEQKITSPSLLDRLIIEAKKSTKQLENNNLENEDATLQKNNETKAITDSTIEKNIEIKNIDSTENIKNVTTKDVDNTLLNSLNENTQDSLKLLNNDTKIELKENIVNETSAKVESTIPNVTLSEDKTIKKDLLDNILPNTDLDSTKLIEVKNNDKDIKNEILDDSLKNKINNPDIKLDNNESKVIITEQKKSLTDKIIDNNIEINKNLNKSADNLVLGNNTSENDNLTIGKEPLSSTVLLSKNLENSDSLIEDNISTSIEIKNSDKQKNETEIVSTKKNEKMSLMDQLIQKNDTNLTLSIASDINPSKQEIVGKDFISSLYLGSQKNKINNQTLFNKNEALTLLKEGTSIDAVKTSAEMLDLGLESIDLDNNIEIEKVEVKNVNLKIENKKDFIDNILLDKNIKSDDIKGLITKSVDASNALIEDTIHLADDSVVSVNSPLSFNIQSKIIGARQQMSTMMSDIAKQMYENYKPPVTAFRINLHPTTLGSIAILMKSDKNNGLSISMNVSNHSTLDALVENQNVLKNSLGKTFNENTQFNLDFSSSNQNSNNQSSSNNQSAQGQSTGKIEPQMDTQSILQLKEENKDREEKSIDYM
jgi:hypothetical protein